MPVIQFKKTSEVRQRWANTGIKTKRQNAGNNYAADALFAQESETVYSKTVKQREHVKVAKVVPYGREMEGGGSFIDQKAVI